MYEKVQAISIYPAVINQCNIPMGFAQRPT